MKLIRRNQGCTLAKAPKNQVPIIERVVHTTADPEFAKLLVISDEAVDAGVAAIKAGAKIVTDVKMIKAGINEARLKTVRRQNLHLHDDERAIKMAND